MPSFGDGLLEIAMILSKFGAYALVALAAASVVISRLAVPLSPFVASCRDFVDIALSPFTVAQRWVSAFAASIGVFYDAALAKARAFRQAFVERHAFSGFEPGLSTI
jgi:hypothetical protein